ncbi:Fungal-trans domain-containing protein [Mycena indigotica]|uniref:Fungal-trans domain-containing protein n=1 Tax=Mycena indigotica TaxID=2126181 RepID=A0A8H6T553_9AGAR|nr:Fungal-trans domain-containing protein [Mycena indigotica]KAF7309610.1 Fungal-trans domain-containing protein [Mycena indigotica]
MASVGGQRQKRRAAALSCAECRRLKLKCSRQFPCRKAALQFVPKAREIAFHDAFQVIYNIPGSLTTGKGNRFVLANTEVLHEKILELSNRIRQLEDGLLDSHTQTSSTPHPLLAPQLLAIKRPLERDRPDMPLKSDKPDSSNEGVEAMGSLSISDGGRSTFFGQAANSWYLLKNETASDDEEVGSPQTDHILPKDLPWLAYSFPFTTTSINGTGEDVRTTLLNLLPNAGIAQRFSESYYRHAAWMYTPISENDFYEKIFTPIYDFNGDHVSAHSLSVLFMVMALGALVDLNMPAHSAEATELYQLGRAALAIDSVLEEPSIPGIQALLLMCHYMFWAGIDGPRWVIMGLVVKLAHSIGLHRDSERWNLDPVETHNRRCLLYEIYTYDSWQSLTFGRPPTFSLAHIDTKRPQEPTTNPGEMSFAAWKHAWSSECLSVLHDRVFGARPPPYSTVMELDKKVRNYKVPQNLQVPGFLTSKTTVESEPPTIELTMQRYCAFGIKEIALFYMHRGFFAQALADNSQDPMGSKYGPSVLAAYRSACTFVGLIESLFKQQPVLTERVGFYFTHVFSCCIVLGSIAMKPHLTIAPSALSHFESACRLFESLTDRAQTVKMLPVLHRLKTRAHEALMTPSPRILDPTFSPQVKTEVDEIAALGGVTRLVTRRTMSPSSPSSDSPSPPVTLDTPQSWTGFSQFQEYGYPHHTNNGQGYDEFNSYSEVQYAPDLSYSWQNFVQQFKE